jgi:hypothetical protein
MLPRIVRPLIDVTHSFTSFGTLYPSISPTRSCAQAHREKAKNKTESKFLCIGVLIIQRAEAAFSGDCFGAAKKPCP